MPIRPLILGALRRTGPILWTMPYSANLTLRQIGLIMLLALGGGFRHDGDSPRFYEGDRPKRWVDENEPWLHGYWFWDWSDERQKIESIDTEERIIAVTPPYHNYGYRNGQRYYALNILASSSVNF